VDLVVDGSLVKPLDEGVEEQPTRVVNQPVNEGHTTHALITPICIFLPPIQLVVDRERYSLFEPAFGVRRPPDDIPLPEKPQRHIEILADIILAPYLDLSSPGPVPGSSFTLLIRPSAIPLVRIKIDISVYKRSILQGAPSQKGIVSYERRDFSVGAHHTDGFVDAAREVRNGVLEVVVRDLEDV
jgi:hypothetical protein